jgi:L-lactate dehydrogenase complex protein LldG
MAREEILDRIRRATDDVPDGERPEDVAVERGYRHSDTSSREEIVARFAETVAEYRATVHRISESELPNTVAAALARHSVQSLVVPEGTPEEWIPDDVRPLRDLAGDRLTVEALDGSDVVLTGCALGIAQTGTIALDSGEGQGRRALTLLPDYHLCVVREEQVYGLVPEAIAALESAVSDSGRAITFISGPSATSDIELNRVEGVHGPRTLEVLIVSG